MGYPNPTRTELDSVYLTSKGLFRASLGFWNSDLEGAIERASRDVGDRDSGTGSEPGLQE